MAPRNKYRFGFWTFVLFDVLLVFWLLRRPVASRSGRTAVITITLTYTDLTRQFFNTSIVDHLITNRHAWCIRHNYDCISSEVELDFYCKTTIGQHLHLIEPRYWVKPVVLHNCLAVYDRVIWIDTDALILKLDESVETLTSTCSSKSIALAGNDCDPDPQINAGFIIIQAGPQTDLMLRKYFLSSRDDSLRHHNWNDQQAWIEAILKDPKGFCILPAHYSWFPTTLGRCMKKNADSFLVHWAGGKNLETFHRDFLSTYAL